MDSSKRLPFKQRYSLKERIDKFQKQIVQAKPGLIPLIIEKHPKSTLPFIDKTKFVCEKFNKFMLIQKMVQGKVEKALSQNSGKKNGKAAFFLYINNSIPKADQQMGQIYQKFKDDDGFLYVHYGQMQTFGA